MSRSARTPRSLRSALTAGGTALLVLLPVLPAHASAPPTDPTLPSGAFATIGDRFADLTWVDGDGVSAIVRDVTGVPAPYTPASGRAVPTATATTAHDRGFTNVGLTTYAIWSTSSDSTPSVNPLVTDVAAVPIVPTALSVTVNRTSVDYGLPLTVAGTLTRTVGGLPVPAVGSPISLYGVAGGSVTPVLLKRLTTDANGRVSTVLRLSTTTRITLKFAGDAFSQAATSGTPTVRLVPRLTGTASPEAIVLRETSLISGHPSPAYKRALVVLQAHDSLGWHRVAETRTDSVGTYRFTVSPPLGVHAYRTVIAGTPAWVTKVSPTINLRVDARDLASGMRGSDVLALQRKLRSLHYEPGALDSAFGYDLTHAVLAFQKVERLPRTGRWTRAERVRVAHPTAWKVRYPASGLAVEVDVTRQVLVLSRAGVVQKIIDVSTGSERVYYQEGVKNIAHTPRGRFHITHKIDGIRVSKLGELYRPSYFYQGYAIHGNGSVPAVPASHGCVRITNPNADRLFAALVVGTPVAVYDE